jgi:hypothetical protein
MSERRILHIEAPYFTRAIDINEDNLCVIRTEDGIRIDTIQEVIDNLKRSPVVNCFGGIIEVRIFNCETREVEYIDFK